MGLQFQYLGIAHCDVDFLLFHYPSMKKKSDAALIAKIPTPEWLESVEGGVLLRLYIQPKASHSEFVGPHGEPPRLKIRVAAPPVDGVANEELLNFLKKKFGVRTAQLELIRGQASRQKDVLCRGVDVLFVQKKLGINT